MRGKRAGFIPFLILVLLLQAAGAVPSFAESAELPIETASFPDEETEDISDMPSGGESPVLRIYSGYKGQDSDDFKPLAEYKVEDLE